MKDARSLLLPSAVGLLAILSFWKVWLIRDVIWDDNTWLLSVYATSNLSEFLDTGWNQFRRPILGTFMYYLYLLHKTSDIFHPVWQTLTLAAGIASPILLFYIVHTLFPRRTSLAFFTAAAFILFHLDHTLAYVSAVHYRLGQALALASIYLTALSFDSRVGVHWPKYIAGLLLALVAHSVLIEPAISLEPGRIAIMGWLLYTAGWRGTGLIKRLTGYGAPFLIAILPLAIHKILHKPYGLYAGTYPTDPFFFLKWNKHLDELWHLLVRDWLTLLRDARHTDITGYLSWVLTLVLLIIVVRKVLDSGSHAPSPARPTSRKNGATPEPGLRHALVLGLILLLPAIWLVEYAGLDTVLFWSQDNAHAVFMQPGYALILGATITGLHEKAASNPSGWKSLLLALPLSLGALINNNSLDLFHNSWRLQTAFWQTFTQRFPTLPERTDFLFDIRGQGALSDLRNHYDHEAWLNLIYSRASGASDFKRYRVVTLEEFGNFAKKTPDWSSGKQRIERLTQLGPETIDSGKLVTVLYVGNRLFVGHEILERFGKQVPYWQFLQQNHNAPETAPTDRAPDTPWRTRLEGF